MFQLDAPLGPAIDSFVTFDPSKNDAMIQKTSLNTIIMQVHRSASMEKLVEALGPYLTDASNEHFRANSASLLAQVLSRLPELYLPPESITSLTEFFLSRLEDLTSVPSCLQALLAIHEHHFSRISGLTAIQTLLKLSKSLPVTQLHQPLRIKYFELLHLTLVQEQTLKVFALPENASNSIALLQNFLHAMKGEKDPRNLVVCFDIAKLCARQLHMHLSKDEAMVELFFEIISCYFPITFTPPPHDPYGIQTQDLVGSLRNVFTATETFAKHVIPFLLDKLPGSVSESNKIDALDTIIHCGENYPLRTLLLQFKQVGDALYMEIINGEKNGVIEAALRAMTRIAAVIGRAKIRTECGYMYAWNTFIKSISDRAMQQMQENAVDSLASACAGKILVALSKDSLPVCAYVLDTAIPSLIKQVEDCFYGPPSQCEAALDRLRSLLFALNLDGQQLNNARPIHFHGTVVMESLAKFLQMQYDTDILDPNTSLVRSPYAKQAAIDILYPMTADFSLSAAETVPMEKLIVLFTYGLLHDDSDTVRCEYLKSLQALSHSRRKHIFDSEKAVTCADLILKICIRDLMSVIHAENIDSHNTIEHILDLSERTRDQLNEDVLSAITALSQDEKIHKAIVEQLLTLYFFKGQSRLTTHWDAILEKNHIRISLLLKALCTIVRLNANTLPNMEFCAMEEGLVFQLLDAVRYLANEEMEQLKDMQQVLTYFAQIASTVMRNVSLTSQQKLLNKSISLFLEMLESTKQLPQANAVCMSVLSVLTAVIDAAKLQLTFPHVHQVIDGLYMLAMSDTADLEWKITFANGVLAASKSLASIVNKMAQDEAINSVIDKLLNQKLCTLIVNEDKGLWERLAALKVFIWVTKALVLCGNIKHHASCLQFLTSNLTMARSQSIRKEIAQGIRVILVEDPSVLQRESGAIVTLLYRQKVFDAISPSLLSFVQKADESESTEEALTAFCFLISNSPKACYRSRLETVLPLILRGLCSSNLDLGSAALEAFKIQIEEEMEHVKPFLKEIFQGLLKQSVEARSALSRVEALECLSKLCFMPYELIHAYKDRVLRQLAYSLDDRKRFVRHSAVRVRNQWSVL